MDLDDRPCRYDPSKMNLPAAGDTHVALIRAAVARAGWPTSGVEFVRGRVVGPGSGRGADYFSLEIALPTTISGAGRSVVRYAPGPRGDVGDGEDRGRHRPAASRRHTRA